ncbi:MAG TPA: hypothetical protein VK493_01060, partial [Bryobacteraceae bacterium]|nr:hypothetical protein [Bryobacteraceae bacterium]
RANAQLSTGPKTETGKAKSSHNALKTGLTGRTVLLPTDDVEAYTHHVERFLLDFQPSTDAEKSLTQSVADAEWRLLRIPSLESGIYAVGRRQLAQEFSDEPDPAVRAAMIEAQVFLTFRKDLRNLALQETRLRRQRETDVAELKALQKERKESADSQIRKAAEYYRIANKCGRAPFDPQLFGFEFTIEQIEDHIGLDNARSFVLGSSSSFSKQDFDRYMASHTY